LRNQPLELECPAVIATVWNIESCDRQTPASGKISRQLSFARYCLQIFGSLFPRLREMAGGSWYVLFLGPLVVRLAAQIFYQRNASIETARVYYEKRQQQTRPAAAAAAIKSI